MEATHREQRVILGKCRRLSVGLLAFLVGEEAFDVAAEGLEKLNDGHGDPYNPLERRRRRVGRWL